MRDLVISVTDRPGEIARVANAGLNVHAVYVIGLEGDLVELAFAVDDAKKAKKALE